MTEEEALNCNNYDNCYYNGLQNYLTWQGTGLINHKMLGQMNNKRYFANQLNLF